MRTVIVSPDGTVLWTSEEHDPRFGHTVTPPADDPAIHDATEYHIGSGVTPEEAKSSALASPILRRDGE